MPAGAVPAGAVLAGAVLAGTVLAGTVRLGVVAAADDGGLVLDAAVLRGELGGDVLGDALAELLGELASGMLALPAGRPDVLDVHAVSPASATPQAEAKSRITPY